MLLQPAPGVCPESPLREGGKARGEWLPEPILVVLAQVAGASVLTGVLDAGVDGHGAVFALRSRRARSAGLGRPQWLPGPGLPLELPASSGMRPGRWPQAGPGTSLLCGSEEAKGVPRRE